METTMAELIDLMMQNEDFPGAPIRDGHPRLE
jgi:hypothetical protein